jgi:hypothetical protein
VFAVCYRRVPHQDQAAMFPRAAVRACSAAYSVSGVDERLLTIGFHRLPIKLSLVELTFKWATDWVFQLKRKQSLGSSTIPHSVGALARCLDGGGFWKHSDEYVASASQGLRHLESPKVL